MGWFVEWNDLEEVCHNDIKVILFSQSLNGEVRRWFTSIPDNSILGYQALEDTFKEKWAENKDPRKCLFEFYSFSRKESESVQDSSGMFMEEYTAIHPEFKPPPGITHF